MNLETILSADSGRKTRNRVGRGAGSGNGKTCGRGHKGEGARSGGKNRGPFFEGGQFPFWMRLPKRGFANFRHKVTYQTLSLARVLSRVSGDEINLDSLIAAGIASSGERIKLVSPVAVDRKLTVTLSRVTASVRKAIEEAGGTVTETNLKPVEA